MDLVRIQDILITCVTLNGNSIWTRSLGRPRSIGEIIQRVLEEQRGDHTAGIGGVKGSSCSGYWRSNGEIIQRVLEE